MVIVDPTALAELQKFTRRAPSAHLFDSEEQLPPFFQRIHITPAIYTVINVELIANKMREANERWEQERQP